MDAASPTAKPTARDATARPVNTGDLAPASSPPPRNTNATAVGRAIGIGPPPNDNGGTTPVTQQD